MVEKKTLTIAEMVECIQSQNRHKNTKNAICNVIKKTCNTSEEAFAVLMDFYQLAGFCSNALLAKEKQLNKPDCTPKEDSTRIKNFRARVSVDPHSEEAKLLREYAKLQKKMEQEKHKQEIKKIREKGIAHGTD